MVASRSHLDAETEAFIAALPPAHLAYAGSSLKFCLLAEGAADLYPRLGRTREWDTAAGQAVLLAAGGSVATLAGAPLGYGKPDFVNPAFVARGRRPPSPGQAPGSSPGQVLDPRFRGGDEDGAAARHPV